MTDGTYAPPVPAADALAAQGSSIRLNDNRTVQLRYTMGSFRLLEARFGSLSGLHQEMEVTSNGKPCTDHATPGPHPDVPGVTVRSPGHGQADPECTACTPPGAMFTALSDAIAPGLLHVRVVHPDTGQTVRLGKDPDLVSELLDPGQLQEYMSAWARAFNEAMAQLDGPGNAAAQVAAPTPSPGPSGTTPLLSSSVAPTASSGA